MGKSPTTENAIESLHHIKYTTVVTQILHWLILTT